MTSPYWMLGAAALALAGCGQGDRTERRGETETASPAATSQDEQADGMQLGMEADQAEARDFVMNAAHSNVFEIRSSEIARQRAQSEPVRSFAQTMISDHGRAGERLREAARQARIEVPTDLDERRRQQLAELTEADPNEFDARYLDFQEEAHEEAVDLFESYAQSGRNPALRSFASNTLPDLRRHLDRVREIRGALDTGEDFLGLGPAENRGDETRTEDGEWPQ